MQALLETVYTCLTNRKIENLRPKNDDDLIPPFARSTAVQVTLTAYIVIARSFQSTCAHLGVFCGLDAKPFESRDDVAPRRFCVSS